MRYFASVIYSTIPNRLRIFGKGLQGYFKATLASIPLFFWFPATTTL
jgi:hypothetical protein